MKPCYPPMPTPGHCPAACLLCSLPSLSLTRQHEHRKGIKVQCEVFARGPAGEHHCRDEEDSNLDGGAEGNGDTEIHLILDSHKHGLRYRVGGGQYRVLRIGGSTDCSDPSYP